MQFSTTMQFLLLVSLLSWTALSGELTVKQPRFLTIRCAFVILAWMGLSLFWTEAERWVVAAGQWFIMLAYVLLVLSLWRRLGAAKLLYEAARMMRISGVVITLVFLLAPTGFDERLEAVNPNFPASYLGLCALFALYLWSLRRKRTDALIAGFLSFGVLVSLSKTTLFTFLPAALFFLLLCPLIMPRGKLLALSASCFIIWLASSRIIPYLSEYISDPLAVLTLTGRLGIWDEAIWAAMETPIVGHGYFSSSTVIPNLGEFLPLHAHNEWLQHWVELGLVGVAIYAVLYAALAVQIKRMPKGARKSLFAALLLYWLARSPFDAGTILFPPLFLFAAMSLCASPLNASRMARHLESLRSDGRAAKLVP